MEICLDLSTLPATKTEIFMFLILATHELMYLIKTENLFFILAEKLLAKQA